MAARGVRSTAALTCDAERDCEGVAVILPDRDSLGV